MALPRRSLLLLLLSAFLAFDLSAAAPPGQHLWPTKCSISCMGTCNQEIGRCDCLRGYTGSNCTKPPPDDTSELCKFYHFHHPNCTVDLGELGPPCLNACNRRGACMGGVCKCSDGFFGQDCSLSLDAAGKPVLLAGTGYTPRTKRPWIYVYELPPKYNAWYMLLSQDRPLVFNLQQRLLSSGVRTANPNLADYFFIPMQVRGPRDSHALVSAIQYINKTWPWWRRKPERHIIVHPGDTGRVEMVKLARDVSEPAIFLTHWGLYEDYPASGWKLSHRPGKDIVVPIYINPVTGRSTVFHHSPHHPLSPIHRKQLSKAEGKAQLQVIFAGRICGGGEAPNVSNSKHCKPKSSGYSQGVRQAVHQHHWNRSGFNISLFNPHYFSDLERTRFCLAPTGGGHGHRQILALFRDCVPLIIDDWVLQPFEPEMNWSLFSVHLNSSVLPHLHTVLEGITHEQHAAMKAQMACAAEHMTFSSITGTFMRESGRYDAFETILEILRVRLLHPYAEPSQLSALDNDFGAFIRCDSQAAISEGRAQVPEGQAEISETGPSASSELLCSLSKYDEVEGAVAPCMESIKRLVGFIPGGAICLPHLDNLASCKRLWP